MFIQNILDLVLRSIENSDNGKSGHVLFTVSGSLTVILGKKYLKNITNFWDNANLHFL